MRRALSVVVTLEIRGTPGNAIRAVNKVLDLGVFQGAIYDNEAVGGLSAVVSSGNATPPIQRILVTLEMQGDQAQASSAVDKALDAGVLQGVWADTPAKAILEQRAWDKQRGLRPVRARELRAERVEF